MAGLDFNRGADLFLGSEEELGQALGISADEVADYRENPGQVPDDMLEQLGRVLTERGRGMMRVGEMMGQSG